jgi:hypothetical protein
MFISIEPGKIGGLYLEYKLPDRIWQLVKNENYSLYIQKQPGNKVENLAVDLKFKNKVKSYNPAGFFAGRQSGEEIGWKTDLRMDKGFEINF